MTNSISTLESLVSDQKSQLDLLQRHHGPGDYSDSEDAEPRGSATEITDEMLRREEEEIEALELRKEEMEEELKRMDVEMGRNIRSFS